MEGTPAAATKSGVSRFVQDCAVIFVIGVGIRAAMFRAFAGSVPVPPLGVFENVGLVGYRLVASLPGVILSGIGVFVIRGAVARRGARSYLLLALGWATIAAFELFRFVSWATFESTHHFLAVETWSLGGATPALLLAHVLQSEPSVLLGVPFATLITSIGTVMICRATDRLPRPARRALVGVVGGVLAASAVAAVGADIASERDPTPVQTESRQPPETAHQAFLYAVAERSGPVARILADAWDNIATAGADLRLWSPPGRVGPRVIPMSEYVRRIDPRQVHRWNVLLVVVESLRADELTMLGGRRVVMPTVETLARESLVCSDMQTQATQSDFATTSLLASQYPLRRRRYRPFAAKLPYPHVLIWDVLKAAGWRTAVFSSQNERWAGMYNFLNTGGVDHFLHSPTYDGPTYSSIDDRGFWNFVTSGREAGKIDDHDTIDEAMAWTDSLPPNTPFFAYINLQASHTPYHRPNSFAPRFGSGRVTFPLLYSDYPVDSAPAVRDLYDNSLAYVDAQLRRLFEELKSENRWDSTLVVVTGDHGEAFFEHGFAAHGNKLYREVTHIPFVMRVPGRPPTRDALPAAALDVVPTILGQLGLPPHPAFQGVDLRDKATRLDRPLFTISQALADEVTVEQGGWVLVDDLRSGTQQLFDLHSDPRETHEVGAAYPHVRDALIRLVELWWASQVEYYETLHDPPKYYAPGTPHGYIEARLVRRKVARAGAAKTP